MKRKKHMRVRTKFTLLFLGVVVVLGAVGFLAGSCAHSRLVSELSETTSVVIPVEQLLAIDRADAIQQLVFTMVMVLLGVGAVFFMMRRYIKFLQKERSYQQDFYDTMSHEIKTPLTAIVASAELWEEGDTSNTTPRQRQLVHEIRTNGTILQTMVFNILEAARLDAHRAQVGLDAVDITDCITQVVSALGSLVDKKELTLEVAIEPNIPVVSSDWDMLHVILTNLVANAIKYTPGGGRIVVRAASEPEQRTVRIAVSDSGNGIKPEDMSEIFTRFTQKDVSTLGRQEGAGLGLYVVSRLLDLLGGTIEVQSVYQEGSTFTVHIPYGDNHWEELR
jgi:signal transduction histidine kinase